MWGEKLKRLSLFLAILLALLGACPAWAAEDKNAKVEEKRLALEQKYNIVIRYDVDQDGTAAIGTGDLATLDVALSPVTAAVVRQVSSYYEQKLGSKLTFAFQYTRYHQPDANVEILASFNTETADIELYIPSSSAGTFTTGASPITILHEFAHAYYFMFADKYGKSNMEKEWVAINGGVAYNEGFLAYAYNKVTFMSSYGATSLEEDFAEIFSHAFLRHREGQGFSHRLMNGDRLTALGKKVAFIEKMLPMYLTDTGTAVANLHRIYTNPINLYYQGIKLSGEQLEYVGCTYPRYVLNGILGYYGLKQESNRWIFEIGGWEVKATDGQYYLVFPGGYCQRLGQPLAQAA